MANAGKGHLFGDAFFNAEYFHVGDETAEKTYINMENEQLEIHELKDPKNDNDAATKKYVDDNAGGGGGSGSQIVEWDGEPATLAEAAAACVALWEDGIVPSVRVSHDIYMGYSYQVLDGVETSFVNRSYSMNATSEVVIGEAVTVLTLVYDGTEWTAAWGEGYFPAGQ